MVKKERTAPDYTSESLILSKLIETGQYDQIAGFLEALLSASSTVSSQARVDILSAARLVCWACYQCQIEIERHLQATEETVKRKNELNQQLYLMLSQMDETTTLPMNLTQPVLTIPSTTEPGPQKEKASTSLSVYCLGTFRVYQNDQLVTDWTSLKARSVFKYLVAHHPTPIAKEVLMDVFWPDSEPEAARRNLHQAIYSLRQTLKQGDSTLQPIQFENDCYRLNPELDIWIDFIELGKQVKAGQSFEEAGQFAKAEVEYNQAEALYQGDFLEEDLYEDWPVWQREHLRRVYSDLIDRLTQYYIAQADYASAIRLCQKILAQDNCYEEMHRRLMECYLAQGRRGLAARQYQAYVQALRTELDVPPSPEIQRFYQQMINGTWSLALNELETVAALREN